jgi:pimeloyl-ACP methyl ester carboxylesterase
VSSPIGAFLCPPGYAGPKGVRALSREGSVALEAVRGARRRHADRRARGAHPYARNGRPAATEPVLLIPGFMAGDWSLGRMAGFLREQGFRTYRSRISVNSGCTMRAADRLESRLESIAIRRDSKVTIVGHSLGGMLARGLAARRPDLVAGIVTMGSPVLAPGAVHALLAWDTEMLTRLTRAGLGGMMSDDCVRGRCARESWEESQSPLDASVGYTAIYSRRDGIVDWRGCLDPFADHVEVRTSHVGMALDPVVFDKVLAALQGQRVSRASLRAAPEGQAGPRRVGSR